MSGALDKLKDAVYAPYPLGNSNSTQVARRYLVSTVMANVIRGCRLAETARLLYPLDPIISQN